MSRLPDGALTRADGPASAAEVLPGVAWEESRTPLAEHLYPAEVEHLARAVTKRREEFETVRGCARRALRRLGVDRAEMVPGPGGEPAWPPGCVGSMTHTAGYCAAAVTTRSHVLSLGIDAEANEPVPDDILDLFASPRERTLVSDLAARSAPVAWDRVLFSAKESVYKTWYPVLGTWLGFNDVAVQLETSGTFTVELTNPDRGEDGAQLLARLQGRWRVLGGHIVTGALILP